MNQSKLILCALLFCMVLSAKGQEVRMISLQESIDIALEHNLNIQRGQLNLQDQEITLRQSKYNQLPNLNLGANYGFNWGRSIDPTSNQFISQRIGFTGLNGNSNWILFNGLQVKNTIEQARVDLQAGILDLERAKNDVILSVANAYLTVIFNSEQMENAQYQLQSTIEQLDRTNKLVDAGSLPVTNKLNLEAQQASDDVNLVQAENNYNLAMLNLKQLMLLPAGDKISVEKPDLDLELNPSMDMAPQQVFESAEGIMPEVKSADLSVKSADLGLEMAEGARYPSLSLNAGFSTNYSSAANRERPIFDGVNNVTREIGFLTSDPNQGVSAVLEEPNLVEIVPNFSLGDQFSENLSRSLSLNLNIPVFNRWQTEAGVQRSKINQQRAKINATEVRNQLRQSIETAYTDAAAAAKSYEASRKQVEALEESFRATKNQYDLGAVNYTDFQVANNNLFAARTDLTRSKYQYLFRLMILDFYQGKPMSLD